MTNSDSDVQEGYPPLKVTKYAIVCGHAFGPFLRWWRRWRRRRAAHRLALLVEAVRQCEGKEQVMSLLGRPRRSVDRRAFREIPEDAVDSLVSDPFYGGVHADLELLERGVLTNSQFETKYGRSAASMWEEYFRFAEERGMVKMADVVEIYTHAGCELVVGFVGETPSVIGTRLETNQWDFVCGLIDHLRETGEDALSYGPGYLRN